MRLVAPHRSTLGNRGPRVERFARHSWGLMFGIWAVVFLLVWTLVSPGQRSALNNPDFQAPAPTPRNGLPVDEQDTIRVFREASPAVCYITKFELRREFFSRNVFEIPQGTGSGFVYDDEGHIVTNYHVVRGADRLEVTLADQTKSWADLVGKEEDKDLAVIKLREPPASLKAITLGTSHDLQVGQKVLAIGNPFGFDQTLTVGVVSALGREIQSVTGRTIRDVIQTDAAINPGNSGGPLLDSAGRLIGVNTQITSPTGANAGIGFAIPADTVNAVVPDLIRFGHVRRPAVGFVPVEDRIWRRTPYAARIHRSIGVPGVLIDSVRRGGGAFEAGLRGTLVDRRGYVNQFGDVLVKVDDQPLASLNQLKDVLEAHNIGQKVPITYVRDDKVYQTTITLSYDDNSP